jgi:hypothetical protein
MPLLQNISFGMSATGIPENQDATAQAPPPQPAVQQQQQDQGSVPTSAKDAISKGLGGMFGGFGKKKKQQEQAQQPAAGQSATTGSPQPITANNSMMDMQVEVTSFSNNALDQGLFEIPAGFTQVQQDPDNPFGTGRHE